MRSENKRDNYFSSDVVYSIMITALFIILVIQIYTYFNFKYQINKLSLLFTDFTRFYIHTSKPPCGDLSNFDLLKYATDRDSESSSGSKNINQGPNLSQINVINEKKRNFVSKFPKINKPSTSVTYNIHLDDKNQALMKSNELPKYQLGNQRRHSTIELTNHAGGNLPIDKFSHCAKYKFRQSESYSFDMANKIYSNENNAQMIPQRRPRLYGVSDESTNGKRYLHSITSTSTPNK